MELSEFKLRLEVPKALALGNLGNKTTQRALDAQIVKSQSQRFHSTCMQVLGLACAACCVSLLTRAGYCHELVLQLHNLYSYPMRSMCMKSKPCQRRPGPKGGKSIAAISNRSKIARDLKSRSANLAAQFSGKSKWGLSKWGLRVLVHNCP